MRAGDCAGSHGRARCTGPLDRCSGRASALPSRTSRRATCFSRAMPSGVPRLKNFAYVGAHAYFLTLCTFRRRPIFGNGGLGERVVHSLLDTSRRHRFSIDAYCVMPDHLHALVTALDDGSDLQAFVLAFKQSTGFHLKGAVAHAVWQTGYYEHVLRADDAALSVARYLVHNPVRAGLVQDARDFALWGSARWTREEILQAIADVPPWRR